MATTHAHSHVPAPYSPHRAPHCAHCGDSHVLGPEWNGPDEVVQESCQQCPGCIGCGGMLSDAADEGRAVLSQCDPHADPGRAGWCDADCLRREVETHAPTAWARLAYLWRSYLEWWDEANTSAAEREAYAALTALAAEYAGALASSAKEVAS